MKIVKVKRHAIPFFFFFFSRLKWEGGQYDGDEYSRLEALHLDEELGADGKSKSEAESLASSFESFEFLLSMVICNEILFAINMMNKKFQSKSMCIDTITKELESVMLFFEKYKNEGFESSMNIAKSLAFDMNIKPILHTKRSVFRKKQFDENNHDEEIQSAEESFRVNYFLVVVDMTIASLKDRFEQLNIFKNIFGFLFDSKKVEFVGW